MTILPKLIILSVSCCLPISLSIAQINVDIPDGFKIEKVLDDSQATNIYCLSSNPRGDVFVSGPGYIRRLIDSDHDGVFESTVTFSETPTSGAQGLFCDDEFLLAVGDGGVWRYNDANQDGIADGPPHRLLEIGTGGEHLAHAIRRGPDGWFYLIAGNATPIKPAYFAGPFSPVKKPRAGFLMRMSPDFKTQEVVAHGFRNAYDFAFNATDQIFVYDSDGERDISLPWYRPTRVFQIQPGDDAGWVDEGWKRPSSYFDMPTEIGALGRGSPTGVECYRGRQFPPEYKDSIFVADWTFGRIMVFRRDSISGRYDRGNEFASSKGQFGFAVTDLTVVPEGSLLVSVGGRGTAGAVYRITNQEPNTENTPRPAETDVSLTMIRSMWDDKEKLQVLNGLVSPEEELRVGALESLIGRGGIEWDENEAQLLAMGLRDNLRTFDPEKAKLVFRIADEIPVPLLNSINRDELPLPSQMLLELSLAKATAAKGVFLERVAQHLATVPEDQLPICRMGQLALGDLGNEHVPEMFRGYISDSNDLGNDEWKQKSLGAFLAAMGLSWDGEPETLAEIGRLIAMTQVNNENLQGLMSAKLTDASDPVADIHWLNCLAQSGRIENPVCRRQVAAGLAVVDQKISLSGLPTDRNWQPRMRQLTERLLGETPELGNLLLELIDGRTEQTFIFEALPTSLKEPAIEKFAEAIVLDWQQASIGQLRVVSQSSQPKYRELFRESANFNDLKEVAISVLARQPDKRDRQLFVAGLDTWNAETVKNSAIALRRLKIDRDPTEMLLAYKTALRLGWDRQDVAVRDQLMLLLQTHAGDALGYEFKKPEKEQRDTLRRWRQFFETMYPEQMVKLLGNEVELDLAVKMENVDWDSGDMLRGKELFRQLKCAQCHEGNSALGPRLEGITKRFGREDLFRSIVDPSQTIPDRYRAIIIETVDGLIIKGTVIYESVDGIMLMDVNGETIRVSRSEIESKSNSRQSLMPAGLLNDLGTEQWADLEAYLKSL